MRSAAGGLLLAVPVDRRAKIVVFKVEPVQPVPLAPPGQRAPGCPGHGQEGGRVRPAKASGVFRRAGQALGGELADRLQHQVTRRPGRPQLPEQALVHQLLQAVQHADADAGPRAHGLDHLQVDTAPEDRAGRQQLPALIAEQVIAPLDGGAQRLLAVRQVTAPAGQQPQRMLQPLQDRLRRQQPDPRRSQLDRQRQAIQPAHDPGDRGGVLPAHGEARHHGRRPLGEQPHRLTGHGRPGRCRRARGLLWEGQRRDRAFLLARDAQRRAAAHHDPEIAGAAQQLRHHRGGRQQVLEVVQDDQEPAVPQVMNQMLGQRPPLRIRQPDALGDRRENQPGIPDRRQPDEVHPIGIIARHARGELDAQPRLAAAARPGQRQQAAPFQEQPRVRQLPLPADETRQRPGQPARTAVENPPGGRTRAGVSGRRIRHW